MAQPDGSWTVAATPDQVAVLRSEVTEFAEQAGLDARRLGDVRLAISEAATNAVLHAYRDRDPGQIRVHACTEGHTLTIVVEDDGFGPLPRPDSPGLGLGLPTIASVADAVELSAGGSAGARLLMRFSSAHAMH
ncbi:ATP-binding protein [Baekduia soli]|nr:ATP-binding protein [Baekduia soli]